LAQKYTTHIIRGQLFWAKVLGQPIKNDYTGTRQWSVDVSPNADGLAELKRLKLTPKIKENSKTKGQGKYIAFRQEEFKKDGSPNDPIQITDIQGNPWPENVKIGNGSVGDVKFSYTDFGTTKGNYIKAIRILKHVPYVAQEFAPLSEDDEFFAGETGETVEPETSFDDKVSGAENDAQDPDLDDDVPFNSGD
jgi:hypothetical protein